MRYVLGRLSVFTALVLGLVARAGGQEVQVIHVHVDPATRISPEISVTVTCHAGHTYYYSYTLHSLPSSQQKLAAVWLRTSADPIAESAPPGWGGGVSFLPSGGTEIRWIVDSEEAMILPGNSLGGYMVASQGPPGIVTVAFQGWVPAFRRPSSDPNIVYITDRRPWEEDHVPVRTVGPVPPEGVPTHPIARLDRLLLLTQEAINLGWLTGPGKSIRAKLQRARDLAGASPDKARKNLSSLLNELEAQRGKHVSQEAYFLLRLNVEQILDGLGNYTPTR